MEPAPCPKLAVIPARGGSRRVPGKNIRKMCGRPLLAYTIDAAIESGIFDEIVVSTDSPEIADLARDLGVGVPFMRAPELSTDTAPVSLATADALDRCGGPARYGVVAQLMANCPLRTAEDIRLSWAAFASADAAAQLSVSRYGWLNPSWALDRDTAGRLRPAFPDRITARSQDLPELVCPSGAVWWIEAGRLTRERTFHLPDRRGWELPWWRAADIDTEEDWEATELLMRGLLTNEATHAT